MTLDINNCKKVFKLEYLEVAIKQDIQELIDSYELMGIKTEEYLFNNKVNPLMLAAEHGHIHLVKYFLDRGIDPNMQSECGVTALMKACSQSYLGVVRFLVEEAKANLFMTDDYNNQAFVYAYSSGNRLRIFKYLFDAMGIIDYSIMLAHPVGAIRLVVEELIKNPEAIQFEMLTSIGRAWNALRMQNARAFPFDDDRGQLCYDIMSEHLLSRDIKIGRLNANNVFLIATSFPGTSDEKIYFAKRLQAFGIEYKIEEE